MNRLSINLFIISLVLLSLSFSWDVSSPYGPLFNPVYDGSSNVLFTSSDGSPVVFSMLSKKYVALNINTFKSNGTYDFRDGYLYITDGSYVYVYDVNRNGMLVCSCKLENSDYSKINAKHIWADDNGMLYISTQDATYVYTLNIGKKTSKLKNVLNFPIDELHFEPIMYGISGDNLLIFSANITSPYTARIGETTSSLTKFTKGGATYYAIGDVGGHLYILDDKANIVDTVFIGGIVFHPYAYGDGVYVPTSNGEIWFVSLDAKKLVAKTRQNLFFKPFAVSSIVVFPTQRGIIAVSGTKPLFEKISDDYIIFAVKPKASDVAVLFSSTRSFTISRFMGCFIDSPQGNIITVGNAPFVLSGYAYAPDAQSPTVWVRLEDGPWKRAEWKGDKWIMYIDPTSLTYGINKVSCYVESSIKEAMPIEVVGIFRSPDAPLEKFNVTISKTEVKPGEIVRVYVYTYTGLPVDNFKVHFNGKEIVRSRYAALRFDSPGKYLITISKPGFEDYTFTVNVKGVSLLLITGGLIILIVVVVGAIYYYYSYIKKV